jgi:coiled-coil domain-containing protein 12
MSSHEQLSAAANDRKARLAQLKSLKRKQPSADDDNDAAASTTNSIAASTALTTTTHEDDDAPSVTTTYLSGRNFDAATRNVKLGFDAPPTGDSTQTLEYKAAQLALATKAAQDAERADAPLDLFKLQPKKPNWDLKRDLEAKMKPLDVATDNAIARLVRERVAAQREMRGTAEVEGDGVGMEGVELVEAMHLKEAQDERDRRREDEEDEADA